MKALHERPGDYHGTCGGKDQVDTNCHCPDLVLELKVAIYSGSTIGRTWSCLCCRLPLDMQRFIDVYAGVSDRRP